MGSRLAKALTTGGRAVTGAPLIDLASLDDVRARPHPATSTTRRASSSPKRFGQAATREGIGSHISTVLWKSTGLRPGVCVRCAVRSHGRRWGARSVGRCLPERSEGAVIELDATGGGLVVPHLLALAETAASARRRRERCPRGAPTLRQDQPVCRPNDLLRSLSDSAED
jgi:hypothetical protein